MLVGERDHDYCLATAFFQFISSNSFELQRMKIPLRWVDNGKESRSSPISLLLYRSSSPFNIKFARDISSNRVFIRELDTPIFIGYYNLELDKME